MERLCYPSPMLIHFLVMFIRDLYKTKKTGERLKWVLRYLLFGKVNNQTEKSIRQSNRGYKIKNMFERKYFQ